MRFIFEHLEDRRVLTGPYAPAAEQEGSTAVPLDDPRIEDWAVAWENYIVGGDVDVTWQTPDKALGAATGDPLDIVSLGRGGQLTVTFARPIRDGDGADFAIFENSISDNFLELGYVDVSSDGQNFVRFPNDSRTIEPVGAFGEVDPTEIRGFAGKYRLGYGTPFDLANLSSFGPLIDLSQVTHVRITDIPGDGTFTDSDGDAIFDPFPTLGSAGVDIEAVAVLNAAQFLTSTVDFELLGAGLPSEGHWNGPDPSGITRAGLDGAPVVVGGFESEGVFLNNIFSPDFGSWNGWAYSKSTDTTTPGFTNQFSAFAGKGAEESSTYAIGFRDVREGVAWVDTYPLPSIELTSVPDSTFFQSVSVTNSTYAALTMLNGDAFAKKFGGVTGDDPDWFLLTIDGRDEAGDSVGEVEFYLADYRFGDNSQDYVIDEWVSVDLSTLRGATSLEFKVTTSDRGRYGLKTLAYFDLDNLVVDQEILPIDISVASISEAAGAAAAVGTVRRGTSDPSLPLTINLSSNDESEATVPPSVVIPPNAMSAEFLIAAVDDAVVDGTQNVIITASAAGFSNGIINLAVTDDDVAALSVTLTPTRVSEADAAPTARFEDIGFTLTEESFWNGSDGSGGFVSDGVSFNNEFNPTFGVWSGWAASNRTDTTTPGFGNQYSAFTGGGDVESSTYGVSFTGGVVPTISLTESTSSLGFESLMVTNTTYAALSMLNGDAFAKKFGGSDGSDPDFFRLTIEGFNSMGSSVGTVESYLADYRSPDPASDYVLDQWQEVDVSGLAGAYSLTFALDSSDVGVFGMNTPAFFAVDSVVLADAVASTGVVTRNGDLSSPVTVSFGTDDATETSVAVSVEIPANQASVEFRIEAINDALVDGVQQVEITASAAGYADGTATLEVTDDDLRSLNVALPANASEADASPSGRFEDVGFTLSDESFWNGSDGSGGIVSDGLAFNNEFNSTFGAWSGWAISNRTDTTTPGFGNQYSAFTGAGALGSPTYGVSFAGGIVPTMSLTDSTLGFESLMVTNTTYAALSMLNGDAFAKKFGGADGTDPDFFRLMIEGHAADSSSVGTVEVYLADYRSSDAANDFVLDDWQEVDLQSLTGATSLTFALDSSDVGVFGMNTPGFFAVDNIVLSSAVKTVGVVSRNDADLSNPLTVALASDDLTEVGVPATVVIPANRRAVEFETHVVDDLLFDGDQDVSILASAAGYADGTRTIVIADNDELLSVVELAPSESGFVATFSAPLDDSLLNLYAPETHGASDVVLLGASGGPISGSLVVDDTRTAATFLGTNGPLAPDIYTVSLRSALAGFQTSAGIPLDGDNDQRPGGHFETSFTIAARADGSVAVSIPDIVRGPGQQVNLPADGAGIPISLSSGAAVRQVSLQVSYDPDLLEISGVAVGSGLPDGSTVTLDSNTPGAAILAFASPADLPSGEIVIFRLEAEIPAADADGIYSIASVIDISSVSILDANSESIPAVEDDSLQLVTYFGDVSGNGRINATDASLIAQHIAGLQTGFEGMGLVDPMIVSDITGNHRINSIDASKVAQFAALIPVPEIPALPSGVTIRAELRPTVPSKGLLIDDADLPRVGDDDVPGAVASGGWELKWTRVDPHETQPSIRLPAAGGGSRALFDPLDAPKFEELLELLSRGG